MPKENQPTIFSKRAFLKGMFAAGVLSVVECSDLLKVPKVHAREIDDLGDDYLRPESSLKSQPSDVEIVPGNSPEEKNLKRDLPAQTQYSENKAVQSDEELETIVSSSEKLDGLDDISLYNVLNSLRVLINKFQDPDYAPISFEVMSQSILYISGLLDKGSELDFNYLFGPYNNSNGYMKEGQGVGYLASYLHKFFEKTKADLPEAGFGIKKAKKRGTALKDLPLEHSLIISDTDENKNLIVENASELTYKLSISYNPKETELNIALLSAYSRDEIKQRYILEKSKQEETNLKPEVQPANTLTYETLPTELIDILSADGEEGRGTFNWLSYVYKEVIPLNYIPASVVSGLLPLVQTGEKPGIEKVMLLIRNEIITSKEFMEKAPLLLRLRYQTPLGPLIIDENGYVVPFEMRITSADKDNEKGPFNEHNNSDPFEKFSMSVPTHDWFGIDVIPTSWISARYSACPIEGRVVSRGIGLGNASDGYGDSIYIEGTGKYTGLFIRLLHHKSVKAKVGQQVKQGQMIGVMGDHIHFQLTAKSPNGKYGPLPSSLLFGDRSGFAGTYKSGGYQDRDIVLKKRFDWLEFEKYLALVLPSDFNEEYRRDLIGDIQRYYKAEYAQLPHLLQQIWKR